VKPDQAPPGGVHEDVTPQLEYDAKADGTPAPACAQPEEGEDGSDTAALSEAAPEPSKAPAPSQRKIEANRRNARKSTGPRTPAGKSRVSRNALKHGIFSKKLLTKDVAGGEDPREYLQLQAAIYEQYRPVGRFEEMLVDWIASFTWRLSRVPRCERGQIDRALANHRFVAEQGRAQVLDSAEMSAPHNPEDDVIFDDLLLPSNGELDKLLRYEESISKQRDRAIAELEKLQDRRKKFGTGDL
jgi:hypothetical protein